MRVAILGAGAFGTAVSIVLCRSKKEVILWSRNKLVLDSLRISGENSVYLPGHQVPQELVLEPDMKLALKGASAVLLCVPAQELRNLCTTIRETRALSQGVPILACSKGIENKSLKFASEIVSEILPENPALVLSGPALAAELARELPCAMVLAGNNSDLTESLASQLSTHSLSIVCSSDIMGVQVAAVLKNIVAIACGMVKSMGLGYNAAAIVMVRGMEEIRTIAQAKNGGEITTMTGLACFGDLVLTCTTPNSRNMSFGMSIGRKKSGTEPSSAQTLPVLVEGKKSVEAICRLGDMLGVKLPICHTTARLLRGELSTEQAARELLSLN